MYQETMNLIHRLANERFNLFRLAGKQSLTPEQTRRLHDITGELYVLWDRYRREYAATHNRRPETNPFRQAA